MCIYVDIIKKTKRYICTKRILKNNKIIYKCVHIKIQADLS